VDEREDRNDAGAGHSSSYHQGLLGVGEGTAGVAWQAWMVAPWKLPLVVVAIAVPIAVAFYAGGPGVGVAVGALVAVAIVAVAVRERPRGAIGDPVPVAGRRRLLVVASRPLEEQEAIREIASAAAKGSAVAAEPTEVLVLSPARIGFLDRWASDIEGARREAQGRLVITVASLAKAGIVAEARVGDEDLVQAIEDQLQSFAATEVILVTGKPGQDPASDAAATELEQRLRAEFRRLVVSDPAAR
jgi:hypothetical protein